MAIGTFTGFDHEKRIGFIEPEDGSSKVLVDADNVCGEEYLQPGTPVKYSSLQGVTGLKAYNVMILDLDIGSVSEVVNCDSHLPCRESYRCDTRRVSRRRYEDEITSVLIAEVSAITVAEIVEVRKQLRKRAARRGWLDIPY